VIKRQALYLPARNKTVPVSSIKKAPEPTQSWFDLPIYYTAAAVNQTSHRVQASDPPLGRQLWGSPQSKTDTPVANKQKHLT
jgi:hypothetical protein